LGIEVIHPRCAGLDVHMDTVMACVRIAEGRKVEVETRCFGTTTGELGKLADWLRERACTHAVMESTGVYWRPVWHILAEGIDLILANPMHVKQVPGRKSDVNDAQWLAELLAHGLVAASFVPEAPVQEVRELTRTRKQFVREVAQHTQRIQKVLEDANLKLTSLVADVLGVSGRLMLWSIIWGETDPKVLAGLARGRMKAKHGELIEALRGRITEHHRFLLRLHLLQIKALEGSIAEVEARLDAQLQPLREQESLLCTIPGISRTLAQVMLGEIGTDMTRFPTVGHLISWAGLCPQMHESAGKRKSTRTRHGAPWLKTALVQAAWPGSRTKNTYFQAKFLRLKARRGPKKAIVAIAAEILRAAYFVLSRKVPYQDLGPDHFDRLDRTKAAKRHIQRLQALGYNVVLTPAS